MVLDTINLKVGDYMTPKPLFTDQETPLREAIAIMTKNNIGNLVVTKNDKPQTVLTEREILSYLVRMGEIPAIKLGMVPTKRFAVIRSKDLVLDAARIMIDEKKRLLVFDEGNLVGIITASDMLRGLRTTGGNPKLDKTISKNVYCCTIHDSIFKAVKIMYRKRIGSVLVTKNDVPYGIFTERDLLTRVIARSVGLQEHLGRYSTSPIISAPLGIGGKEAAEIMSLKKIKRLTLTKKEEIVGIITARDIVSAFRDLQF